MTHQDSKKVVKGLRAIYQARTLGEAENNLLELESTWKAKYPILVRFWLNNWEQLATYSDFPQVIRKAIYTNNPIESYHRQIRKHTKDKRVFPSDRALLKLVYVLSRNIMAKWGMPVHNGALVIQQLAMIYEERPDRHLKI